MKQVKGLQKKWNGFNKHVILFKPSGRGQQIDLQTGGCGCFHRSFKGFVYTKFVSSSHWFNPDWWYKNFTVWGKDYPKKIYFKCNSPLIEKNYKCFKDFSRPRPDWKHLPFGEILEKSREEWQEFYNDAEAYCKPASEILQEILKVASYHLGEEVLPAFDIDDHEKHWEEAYIPVLINNKKYILAWENCD